jgi:DNA end-binding protein Ku
MRSIWNGSISFGLVSIPIKLFPAIQSQSIHFHLLHSEDKGPIKYKRVCSACGKEVEWKDMARGFEVSKNRYYMITNDELGELKPEKTNAVDIVEFVDGKRIDPIYFSNHYYAAPDAVKEKAYFLFREVLQTSGKIAIGTVVIKDKKYTCAIKNYKEGLLLTTLNYAYEVRDISQIEELKEMPKLREEEVELAEQLIQKLAKNEFGINKYKDTYSERLQDLIRRKESGEEVIVVKEQGKPKTEENIIDALKASLKK